MHIHFQPKENLSLEWNREEGGNDEVSAVITIKNNDNEELFRSNKSNVDPVYL